MGRIRILSHSREPFLNRAQAGVLLSQELLDLSGRGAVVLGIPRGGLLVAQALAERIQADLDIVLSRKLGVPGQEELAFGALSEDGEIFLNQDVMQQIFIPGSYIQQEKEHQQTEIARRKRLIREILTKVNLNHRIAIVTDDGAATGATLQAAIWTLRREQPDKLIAAIPVASDEAVSRISGDVDELVCLRMPEYFMAVGQFYLQFAQVTDEQVLEILKQERSRKKLDLQTHP